MMEDRALILGCLATPVGLPGSGRLRYGAAMALHRAGEIGDAALEVFRICAAMDRQDPAGMLAERGLPALPVVVLPPVGIIRALVVAADRYLSALPGPGVAEVRAGLNAARGGAVTQSPGATNPVIAAHLPAALATLAGTHPDLAGAIAAAAPLLNWLACDGYPVDQIGENFASNHAFAPIIGENAPITARDYSFGLFLIAPHVLYRDHHHAAPELYAPLTGPHGWRFGPDTRLVVKPAHEPVWNDPFRPHLTKVGPLPFLALFGWTRDVNAGARVIPATDWAALDALRLAL